MKISARKFSFALLFIAFLATEFFSRAEPVSSFLSRNWQIDDGLPHNSVLAITQTRDGYLWLATPEGLARFDGVRFTIFDAKKFPEIKGRIFTSICESKDGSLWFGTRGALHRLQNGKIVPYTTENGLV